MNQKSDGALQYLGGSAELFRPSSFFAIGMTLEYQGEILHRLRNLEHEANKNAGPAPRPGNSKSSLDKLSGFKL